MLHWSSKVYRFEWKWFVCSWFLFLLDKKNVKYLIYGEKKKKNGDENMFQEEIQMEGNL